MPKASQPAKDLGQIFILIVIFLVTRIATMASLRLEAVAFVANDVSYYGYHLYHLSQGAEVMQEYPMPALWLLQTIYTLGGGWQHWTPVYAALFLLLDALVAVSLYRPERPGGTLFWILFTGASGAIVWYRFDLVPAALVAWACLLVLSRPKVAGALIGLGAAIKLWPALLIAPMLAPHPWRCLKARSRWIGFAVAGSCLAAASVLTSGWTRSISPLTFQSERGLQIESVPATVLMFLRTFTKNPSWHVFLSEYNALELSGPGVAQLLRISSALTLGAIGLAGFLTVRLLRNLSLDDPRTLEAIVLCIAAIVLALVVSNKTLSPQYVLWLAGPVAVLLMRPTSAWLKRHLHLLAASLVVIAALTQATYPWLARGIMAIPLGSGAETAVLILRNLALVVLTGYCIWLALRASRKQTNVGKLPASSRSSLRPHDRTEGKVANATEYVST